MLDFGESFCATEKKNVLRIMCKETDKVYIGDNKACNIIEKGIVRLNLPNGGTWSLNGVRHIPSLRRNLIFVGQFTSLGHTSTFTGDT